MKTLLFFAFASFCLSGIADPVCKDTMNCYALTDSNGRELEIFDRAEVMPEYATGKLSLCKDIQSRIKIPDSLITYAYTKIVVKFYIDKDATVKCVTILKSYSHPYFCDVVKNAIYGLPGKWRPASQRGNPVRCFYTMAITIGEICL